MAFKIVLGITVLLVSFVALSAAEDGTKDFTLPGLVPCNHTETPGASCQDCNRLLICTKLGGFILPCWLPGPHCNNGTCSTEPSDDCEAPTTPGTPDWDNYVRVADSMPGPLEIPAQPIEEPLSLALPPIFAAAADDDLDDDNSE